MQKSRATTGRSRWRPAAYLRAAVVCALVALCCGRAAAVEEYERFLDALRDRGYYDTAIDYLDRASRDQRTPAAFKQRILYEKGVTFISAERAERDADQKVKFQNSARDALSEFVKSTQDQELIAEAESQLGNVLVARAKTQLARAKQPRFGSQKTALTDEARALFSEAQKTFESAENKFAEQFKNMPKTLEAKGTAPSEARQEARVDLARARLFSAQALYESASAYPAESAERKKLLEASATKFGELYEKHRQQLFGQLARTYQAGCYLDLGDTKRALSILSELVDIQDDKNKSADFLRLKSRALHMALKAWTSENEKKYQVAADKGVEWSKTVGRGPLGRTPDGLAIHYFTAVALARDAAAPKQEAARKRQDLAEARKQVKDAATFPGEYQDDARKLYQELMGSAEGDEKPPANFAEAIERAGEALDAMQGKLQQIRMAPSINDTANVPTYEKESDEARDKARALFRAALDLRVTATPLEELNAARFKLCYLCYQVGDYYDAAVLGDFLARRHPTSANARQAGKIALLGYLQIYNGSAEESKPAAKQRMVQMADFLTRRFAGDAEADEAWMTLMVVATGEHNVPEVLGYLTKIPENSPRRGEAELKAGQSLWIAALTGARLPEESRPPQAEIDKLREQAQQLLARGVERITQSADAGVNFSIAAAALSLSQIYVNSNRAADAVKLLEDKRIGSLMLVEAKDPIAAEGTFAIEACKVALRAYVAEQQFEKAEKVMNLLEAHVGASGDAKGMETLIAIYRGLGQELESHVAVLRRENRTGELEAVSRGFDLFLDRVLNKKEGNNYNVLNWVAETYARLGAGLEADDGTGTKASRAYFEKSAAADEKILHAMKTQKDFAPPESSLAIHIRLAKSQRRAGHYKEAIDGLAEVLKQKPMLLDVQKEAAYTYQEWGRENPATYSLAISGARKTTDASGKEYNILWGWTRLAVLTQRDKKFQDVFHEAKYNLSRCWLQLALTQNGSEKTESLKKAESALLLTVQLHPNLGNGEWLKKYDTLLRQIQHELGQPQTGLPKNPTEPTEKAQPEAAAANK